MKIVICGVGALGSAAAVSCRSLDATLRLIDFDRVESKNLLAQAFVKAIGRQEPRRPLSSFSSRTSTGSKVEAFGVRLVAGNAGELLGEGDLLVDCFDNAESRRLISDWARAQGKPCVHAALSADGHLRHGPVGRGLRARRRGRGGPGHLRRWRAPPLHQHRRRHTRAQHPGILQRRHPPRRHGQLVRRAARVKGGQRSRLGTGLRVQYSSIFPVAGQGDALAVAACLLTGLPAATVVAVVGVAVLGQPLRADRSDGAGHRAIVVDLARPLRRVLARRAPVVLDGVGAWMPRPSW